MESARDGMGWEEGRIAEEQEDTDDAVKRERGERGRAR